MTRPLSPDEKPAAWSVADIVQRYRISAPIIRAAIKSGELAAFFPGEGQQKAMVLDENLQAWLLSRPTKPAKKAVA